MIKISNGFAVLVTGFLALMLSGFPAGADDTTEAFELGLSNLEGYFIQEQERDLSHEWVIGYGVTDRFSIGLGYQTSPGEKRVVPSYSAEAFYTVWNEVVEWDLMAGAGLEDPPHEEGEDLHSYWLTSEVSLPTALAVPYARLGYEYAYEDGEIYYPMTAGIVLPFYRGAELIFGHDWFYRENENGPYWSSWSVGLNAPLTDEFELITEYRESGETGSDDRVRSVSAGFILTMASIGDITSLE